MLITLENGRLQYGANQSFTKDRKFADIVELCYHHSACCVDYDKTNNLEQILSSINNNHKGRLHPNPNGFGNHIAYHAIIGINGEIVKTRPVEQYGRHCSDLYVNRRSVAVCYLGNGNLKEPNEKQYRAMATRSYWIRKHTGNNVQLHPHFDFKATACPGDLFDHEKYYSYVRELQEQDENKSLSDEEKAIINYVNESLPRVKNNILKNILTTAIEAIRKFFE